MNKQNQIVALRLASILTRTYHYQLMKIDHLTGDIVLGFPKHPKYPTIHIRLSSIAYEEDKSEKMVEAVNSLNRQKRDIKLLTFSFVDEPFEKDTHHLVALNQANEFNDGVLSTFPRIKQLNWEIKDEQTDLKMAVDQLNKTTLRHQQERVRKMSLKNSKGALTIIAICVFVHLLGIFITSLANYETTYMILLGGIYVPMIQGAHEIHRFITAGFIHANFTHLFVNMLSLYNISLLLEKAYGTKKFLIALLVSVIGGNLVVYVAETQAAISVGLSTGIYGLLGLLVVYLFETNLIKSPVFKTQLAYIFGINLIINFLPNVSWLGHLGGFVSGILVGMAFVKKPQWQLLRKNTIIASLLLVVMLGVMGMNRNYPKEIYPGSDFDTINVIRKLKLDFYADYLERNMIDYYNEGDF